MATSRDVTQPTTSQSQLAPFGGQPNEESFSLLATSGTTSSTAISDARSVTPVGFSKLSSASIDSDERPEMTERVDGRYSHCVQSAKSQRARDRLMKESRLINNNTDVIVNGAATDEKSIGNSFRFSTNGEPINGSLIGQSEARRGLVASTAVASISTSLTLPYSVG